MRRREQRWRFVGLGVIIMLAGGCGNDREAAPLSNDTARQARQLRNQVEAMTREAEANTSAIEQAMENEGAAIFENRAILLNELAGNQIAPEAPGNAAR